MSDYDLRYISLGAGVQSSAMLVMANEGMFGKVDVAIFADTMDEPQHVYDYLDMLIEYSDIPIEICKKSEGGIAKDTLNSKYDWIGIPTFTLRDGKPTIGRRQCTNDYKVQAINSHVKNKLGIEKGKRAKGVIKAECLIGITIDEAQRMKDSRVDWIVNSWPLIDMHMNRNQCYQLMIDAGMQEPKKSSCFHCPFHSDEEWTEYKTKWPMEFEKACEFDKKLREKKANNYLHRSCKPLSEIDFVEYKGLFDDDLDFGFGNECEGMCGV